MTTPLATRPAPPPSGAGEVAVVYAGDYVNKLGGQRIERECLTVLDTGCRTLVISFRDTELVNSIGVSILIGVIDLAEQRGTRVVFSSVSRHNSKLFELLGLTRHVTVADSEESFLSAHAPGTPTSLGTH
ncbi:MAG TPA: STAS domain-containing protein [Pyrinomonadaceae bacterium]|nr:STAS domain-containing protein [Pyrinomonadaceae bacterium]